MKDKKSNHAGLLTHFKTGGPPNQSEMVELTRALFEVKHYASPKNLTLMQEAVAEGEGAMAAVMGAAPEVVAEACERERESSMPIVFANMLCSASLLEQSSFLIHKKLCTTKLPIAPLWGSYSYLINKCAKHQS